MKIIIAIIELMRINTTRAIEQTVDRVQTARLEGKLETINEVSALITQYLAQ